MGPRCRPREGGGPIYGTWVPAFAGTTLALSQQLRRMCQRTVCLPFSKQGDRAPMRQTLAQVD
ncbi:MAG TPA: hypothetical protein VFC14_03960 [Burkholderiales bacterium]|nr:hypothetical protein [Burkholderiales bacterium]